MPVGRGSDLITAERRRQVDEEGLSSEHDSQHEDMDLVMAALAYLDDLVCPRKGHPVPATWPWEPPSWKPTPTDIVRQLTKAGALIAAEIDRLEGTSVTDGDAQVGADVHLVISWNSDYEQAYLEEGAPGESDGTHGSYEAVVPAELWVALVVARHAYNTAHSRLVAAAGFDEERGRMATACAAWAGDLEPGRSSWKVVVPASGDPDRWPVIDAQIAWKDTQRDAVSFLESLPNEFHLLGISVEPPHHIRRDQLRVEAGVCWGPSTSDCHRCGWARDEHPAS
jgi:hypothetical protein